MENTSSSASASGSRDSDHRKMFLFWACFFALVTTSFGFVIRVMLMDTWATEFGLSQTQKGEIFGVGLWPYAISIVFFSLIVDRIGYGRAIVFAVACHVISVIVTISAKDYWGLYVGNLIVALGNGTVETVINPVIATLFPRDKTKWLNILHAGWPGGLVLGGILTIAVGETGLIGSFFADAISWKWKVGLILLPTAVYGAMMLRCHFPVNERVAAGVPHRDMLREVGMFGGLILVGLMFSEIGRVFVWEQYFINDLIIFVSLAFGVYVLSFGRAIYVFLVLITIPLAITELGTDSWISDLMAPEMESFGLEPGWVLVYTSFIMLVLRFFAGPIVHKLSPIGLLVVSSALAMGGLLFLSQATGAVILIAATLYGVGKTFLWPTTMGVVAERFPRGGALAINSVSAVGMMSVGVLGSALLGTVQDRQIDVDLRTESPALHQRVVGQQKLSVFGSYQPLDVSKVERLDGDDRRVVQVIQDQAKKGALRTVALFPLVMLLCYLGLMIYFKRKGGYEAVDLSRKNEGGSDVP